MNLQVNRRSILRESFQVSPTLFYISSGLFIIGNGLGLVFDSDSARLATILNTSIGLSLNILWVILARVGSMSRNVALGALFYVSGLVFIVETFFHDYTGELQVIYFLTTLIMMSAFSAVAGILVTKFASVILGTALLAYLVLYGNLVIQSHPILEEYWAYLILAIVGLIFMITYYRHELEKLIMNLHNSKEAFRIQRDQLEVLNSKAERALSDLKAAQKKIVVQEKLASLGALTAGIAHEIKNPLNFVNNFSESSIELMTELEEHFQAIQDQLPEDRKEDISYLLGELVQNMKDINEHGRRGDRIVKNMLMHSRGGKGNYTNENINSLVEECLQLSYHGLRAQDQEFKAEFELNLDADTGAAEIVRPDLSRVLLNIMNNGFYAAADRHKKEIEAGKSPADCPVPKLTISSSGTADKVRVSIRDNGPGIPAEVLADIFTPFFTTKPTGKGTGLGLSISREIVHDEHGGSIEVASGPGEYTEFVVTLPRKARIIASEKKGEEVR